MIPHERSLVAKMKDKPFALIGVNSDIDFAALKKKEFIEEKITWRSFSCGPEGTTGAIPSTWGIGSWPTIFLIDAKGCLRNRWVGNPGEDALDNAIDVLVGEVKSGSKPDKKKSGKQE
jgi:hypothetical protein